MAGTLQAAFAAGRLTWQELDDRLRATAAARTWYELGKLTADLPAPEPAPREDTRRIDPCLICLLSCLCPPAGIAALLYNRRLGRPKHVQLR